MINGHEVSIPLQRRPRVWEVPKGTCPTGHSWILLEFHLTHWNVTRILLGFSRKLLEFYWNLTCRPVPFGRVPFWRFHGLISKKGSNEKRQRNSPKPREEGEGHGTFLPFLCFATWLGRSRKVCTSGENQSQLMLPASLQHPQVVNHTCLLFKGHVVGKCCHNTLYPWPFSSLAFLGGEGGAVKGKPTKTAKVFFLRNPSNPRKR